MPFFRTPDGSGAQIHYEIIEGVLPQDTMFIHGNMASNRWWLPSQEIWKKRAKGSQPGAMILVEFRGCGKSSPPISQAEVDMDLFAQDFIGLAKELNRGKMNLVGHSTGGFIASLMLAQAPELFGRAVFLDPVGAKGVTFDAGLTSAFEEMKTNKELVAIVMGSTIKGHDPASDFFRQVVVEDAFYAVQTVGDKVLRALDGLDRRTQIGKVRNPVLVLHGEHDSLLPMEDSREMASLMNAQFSIISDQGHCANVENPEKFVQITSEFLFPN